MTKIFNPYKSNNRSPFIIAEVGINHNGDINLAKKLIMLAKETGCDAVKFQKRTIENVYTQEYLAGHRDSPWGKTQRAQKEGLEFTREDFIEIDEYCKKLDIMWTTSSWDVESQKFLREFNVPFNKVASPMLTHRDLLVTVASEGKHTFISTGMSSYEDIDRAVKIFKERNCPFTLLHCVSKYPLEDDECNIGMIYSLKKRYKCPVGYSGHEKGVLPSILATALGAVAIERHVTLDRTMYGSDQSASLEKRGLELLVRDSKRVAQIIGNGQKSIIKEEKECAKKLRYFSKKDFLWE